ncbi:aminodeoxychorismate/anthranilate synthase component II [Pseudodesulfovibrio thermohalotolerans]|uniref:aminodeoxychorismate/anthranilate synthase component II n=1 Tax=Pseudodesulfovibrio thermohalotolerans TaxID=2880651 RepID=UPI0022B9D9AD|nr:aminodeoxychorismate/anthranilate synthase component II [Pseudodesulfovibrio thermohalotolerans]WFS62619.1 aminodeoxychorismate/anthranilate synthase component II [Pseudodesulfovibrio thermohalotolerans]
MNILLIDNDDSFTRNLEHLLAASVPGATVEVTPYARLKDADLEARDLLVISPGPGAPSEYLGYDRVFSAEKPILGVCLGMQIVNERFGGLTGRLHGCVHGKTDTLFMDGAEHVVARYHSLHVTEPGAGLDVLAANRDGIVMCMGSRTQRVIGCQFHPESFLSRDGGWFIDFALDYLGLR